MRTLILSTALAFVLGAASAQAASFTIEVPDGWAIKDSKIGVKDLDAGSAQRCKQKGWKLWVDEESSLCVAIKNPDGGPDGKRCPNYCAPKKKEKKEASESK